MCLYESNIWRLYRCYCCGGDKWLVSSGTETCGPDIWVNSSWSAVVICFARGNEELKGSEKEERRRRSTWKKSRERERRSADVHGQMNVLFYKGSFCDVGETRPERLCVTAEGKQGALGPKYNVTSELETEWIGGKINVWFVWGWRTEPSGSGCWDPTSAAPRVLGFQRTPTSLFPKKETYNVAFQRSPSCPVRF